MTSAPFIGPYPANDAEDFHEKAEKTDERLLAAERPFIDARRKHYGLDAVGAVAMDAREDDIGPLYRGSGLCGLALSGGGERSAIFCLGVLQFFAKKGILKHFDYLSTVSGGGYLGASLTWFLHGAHGFGTAAQFDADARFPFGTSSPKPDTPISPNPRLDWLRYRGNYLNPGRGITLASGVAIVLRGLVLNLAVWVPIFTALFAAAVAPVAAYRDSIVNFAATWLCWTPIEAGILMLGSAASCQSVEPGRRLIVAIFALLALLLSVGVILFVAGAVAYSLRAFKASRDPQDAYSWRRCYECAMGRFVLHCIALPATLICLPLVHYWLEVKGAASLISAGAASGLWSFARTKLAAPSRDDSKNSVDWTSIIATTGSVLLLYGFALLCFSLALRVLTPAFPTADWPWSVPAMLMCVALAVAVVSGRFANVNLIGLHRFYRDRLMEAFLPDQQTEKNQMATAADKAMLKDLALPQGGQPGPIGPYHLINTNLIVVNTEDRERGVRGGESFVLSPRYCGSDATGWAPTEIYLGGQMSLATAMAISGAAANPNAGCGGAGPTRSPMVSILMSLLNIRLGYFVPRPRETGDMGGRPNHFVPGFSAACAALFGGVDDTAQPWLQLSDGGHFDNTGLYELLRRRVELIVACDASADPDYLFGDLVLALERARLDFQLRWHVDRRRPIDNLVPSLKLGYPRGGEYSASGYTVIHVEYRDGRKAVVLYLTTTLIEKLGETVLGYCAANPGFPDQSTADQFFDERQFEAYRILGWSVAETMVAGTGLVAPTSGGSLMVRSA